MAFVDGARSEKSSSEEGFKFECGPCGNDGVIIEAIHFCPDCKEYLCESCETSHNRMKITRNHTLILVSEMSAKESYVHVTDSNSLLCLCHRNENEIYCKLHDEVFCSDCKAIKHRLCQTVFIEAMVNEFDQNIYKTTLENANSLKEKLMKLQTTQKEDREKLSAETGKCKEEIAAFRAELNQQLDKIEESVLNDMCKASDLHKKVIGQHLDVCGTALRTLSLDYNSHMRSQESRNRRLTFVTNFRLMRTIKDIEDSFKCMHEEIHEPRLSFDRNPTISVVLDTDSFGILNHNLGGQSKTFNADMKVDTCRSVNIKMQSDKSIPWISGSVFLPSGHLVLCDRNNDCLKVCDHSFTLKDNIQLSGKPRDCCVLNGHKLFVTLPEKNQIQYFQTDTSIQLLNTINLDTRCDGITSLNQDIFVTCHRSPNKEIRVLDHDGNLKKKITLTEIGDGSFKFPNYIAVHNSGDLYISEVSNDLISQVRAFSKDGICKYTCSNSSLQSSVGMLVDENCRLLVCSWQSNSVHLLSGDAFTCKEFFEQNIDLTGVYTVCYRESDATLVVTFRDRNNILVFKIK